MSALVDLLHLVVVIAGVGVGAWALVGLRSSLPRGRFAVFGAGSAAALFGCAALAGEIGLLPPAAWFAVIIAAIATLVAVSLRLGRHAAAWR